MGADICTMMSASSLPTPLRPSGPMTRSGHRQPDFDMPSGSSIKSMRKPTCLRPMKVASRKLRQTAHYDSSKIKTRLGRSLTRSGSPSPHMGIRANPPFLDHLTPLTGLRSLRARRLWHIRKGHRPSSEPGRELKSGDVDMISSDGTK